ncbi:hypothetical protein TNCV_640761 [Trichonephila clavipes]|nr:hypothetical protein TNCV_640761 [Trichonephila clavipes]
MKRLLAPRSLIKNCTLMSRMNYIRLDCRCEGHLVDRVSPDLLSVGYDGLQYATNFSHRSSLHGRGLLTCYFC